MDIGKAFVDSWNILIKNLGTILIAFLIVIILSIVSLGVLCLPLLIGLQMLFVKAKRGESITANSVLDPINRYFSIVFGHIGIAFLVFFGILLVLVPGLAWASWWMYAVLFMYDKNMHIEDGMRASKEVVRKNGTWWHLLFLIIVWVVDNIFVWFFGIFGLLLKLITTPLTMGAIASAYVDETK